MKSVSETSTVTIANLPPQITGANIPAVGIEGQPLAFSATATDPAGTADPLSFIWTITHPDGSTSEVGGRNAQFTPPDDGAFEVSLTVDDEEGRVATTNVGTVDVSNADPMLGPIITPTDPVNEGQPATIRVSAPDVAGDVADLSFVWTIATPGGSQLGLTGPSIEFAVADDGIYEATVVVTDGDGGSATAMAQFTGNNLAPTIDAFNAPALVFAGQSVSLSANGSDPGGENDQIGRAHV